MSWIIGGIVAVVVVVALAMVYAIRTVSIDIGELDFSDAE